MFCVLYEFEVTQKDEAEFKAIWHQLTEIIKESCGGLGSRLHKDILRENIFIAYAQWPDKATWDIPSKPTNTSFDTLRKRLRTLCTNIHTLYQLDMVDDLLSSPATNYSKETT